MRAAVVWLSLAVGPTGDTVCCAQRVARLDQLCEGLRAGLGVPGAGLVTGFAAELGAGFGVVLVTGFAAELGAGFGAALGARLGALLAG